MIQQSIMVNVHDARVRQVVHLDGYPIEQFIIKLGDGEYNGAVTFFTNDDQWDAIVAAVAEARAAQKKESVRAS